MRDRGQINSPMAQLYYRPMNKNLLLLQKKLNRLDCEYADLRCVQLERVKIRTHKAALDEVKETHSTGIGFRVLKDGAFGFFFNFFFFFVFFFFFFWGFFFFNNKNWLKKNKKFLKKKKKKKKKRKPKKKKNLEGKTKR